MPNPVQIILEAQDRASRQIKRVTESLHSMKEATEKASETFIALGEALGAFELAKGIIEATSAMEKYQAKLYTVLGSQRAVNAEMEQLRDIFKHSPLELGELTDAYVKLKSLGLDASNRALTILGDSATLAGKKLSDAVEAIMRGATGRVNRLVEFGITKQMLANLDKNLFDAKGKVTSFARFQEDTLKLMADRSGGTMERFVNTIEGKWDELKKSIFDVKAAFGNSIATPVINAITVIQRAFGQFFTAKETSKIGDWVAHAFSVEHMREFVTYAVRGAFVIAEAFKGFFGQIDGMWRQTIARVQWLFHLGEYWGAKFRGNKAGMDAATAAKAADAKAIAAAVAATLAAQQGHRSFDAIFKEADRWTKSLFAGLSNAPYSQKPGKPALDPLLGDDPASKTGKSGMDRITEMILGGGKLARLGVKASQLGGGLGTGPRKDVLRIEVDAGRAHLSFAIKEIVQESLAQAIKNGYLAVPGGR